ncbi:hypothetical protein LTE61_004400 [Salmonella enterica subsp. enterica serovar Westminster]|nr:hypothetical protein [Salmonella enterica subsp. enterica serovar Westminster]
MHRIDTATASRDKFGAGKNGFTNGNPQTGVPATDLNAAFFDSVQEEICNVIERGAQATLDSNNDTQLLDAIRTIINNAVNSAMGTVGGSTVPDVGELFFTTNLTDPNAKYPGTAWQYLGEGLTLRTAKKDGSDLNAVTGADSVTLSSDNMPPHAHSIGGSTGSSDGGDSTTGSFNIGTKTSSSSGAHQHGFATANSYYGDSSHTALMGGAGGTTAGSSAGSHSHSVVIGSHTHTVSIPAHSHGLPASTANSGGGASFSVLQRSINVAVWVRTA